MPKNRKVKARGSSKTKKRKPTKKQQEVILQAEEAFSKLPWWCNSCGETNPASSNNVCRLCAKKKTFGPKGVCYFDIQSKVFKNFTKAPLKHKHNPEDKNTTSGFPGMDRNDDMNQLIRIVGSVPDKGGILTRKQWDTLQTLMKKIGAPKAYDPLPPPTHQGFTIGDIVTYKDSTYVVYAHVGKTEYLVADIGNPILVDQAPYRNSKLQAIFEGLTVPGSELSFYDNPFAPTDDELAELRKGPTVYKVTPDGTSRSQEICSEFLLGRPEIDDGMEKIPFAWYESLFNGKSKLENKKDASKGKSQTKATGTGVIDSVYNPRSPAFLKQMDTKCMASFQRCIKQPHRYWPELWHAARYAHMFPKKEFPVKQVAEKLFDIRRSIKYFVDNTACRAKKPFKKIVLLQNSVKQYGQMTKFTKRKTRDSKKGSRLFNRPTDHTQFILETLRLLTIPRLRPPQHVKELKVVPRPIAEKISHLAKPFLSLPMEMRQLRIRLGVYADPNEKVFVAPSGVSGMGLFARQPFGSYTAKANRCRSRCSGPWDCFKADAICTYFGHEVYAEKNPLYQETNSDYLYEPLANQSKTIIDAEYSACLGRYINEPARNSQNLEFRWKPTVVFAKKATTERLYFDHNMSVIMKAEHPMHVDKEAQVGIEPGEELFVSYNIPSNTYEKVVYDVSQNIGAVTNPFLPGTTYNWHGKASNVSAVSTAPRRSPPRSSRSNAVNPSARKSLAASGTRPHTVAEVVRSVRNTAKSFKVSAHRPPRPTNPPPAPFNPPPPKPKKPLVSQEEKLQIAEAIQDLSRNLKTAKDEVSMAKKQLDAHPDSQELKKKVRIKTKRKNATQDNLRGIVGILSDHLVVSYHSVSGEMNIDFTTLPQSALKALRTYLRRRGFIIKEGSYVPRVAAPAAYAAAAPASGNKDTAPAAAPVTSVVDSGNKSTAPAISDVESSDDDSWPWDQDNGELHSSSPLSTITSPSASSSDSHRTPRGRPDLHGGESVVRLRDIKQFLTTTKQKQHFNLICRRFRCRNSILPKSLFHRILNGQT